MKKIFLHIGYHKTGTSALQEYLNDHREELKEDNIFYPKIYENKYPGHVDLSWAFNKTPPKWGTVNLENAKNILDFYKDQIESTNCSNIIISSEDFALLDTQPESIIDIKEYFKNYELQIIAYVRNPIDFMFSLYSHAVRARHTSLNFKEYISRGYGFKAANYALRIEPWSNIFGRQNVILKKYDPISFKENNLVVDFFNILGLITKTPVDIKKSNIGIHPWLIKPYIEVSKSNLDEVIKQNKLKQIRHLSLGLPKESSIKYLIDDRDIAIIENVYKDANLKLKREYGIEFQKYSE